ncbi:S41 family peptidase [Dyadobacter sp. CY261]|uniref:S41 family peptidase n=1 Tax=Dyadobacter sp. CY261 TaxID=2907203 RepID=UPI001F194EAE|nr:S41 family peptidase [Dyadobacter sp. CY261]MCF0071110.1 S41 family peptidase [Dyadobacter sp. CY261]
MKSTHLFKTFILALLCQMAFAQTDSKESKPLSAACGCQGAVEQAIDKVTRIYAGFDDKVTATTRPAYDKLLKDVRTRAPKAKTEGECLKVLQDYTAFFKDSHVFMIWQGWVHKGVSAMEANARGTDLVQFKQLNKDFLYLKLAAFDLREVGKIDSILLANKTLLAQTPHLIFDLRGNGGGNASTSDEMAKLIYTNTFVYPSWDYRSSEEYITRMDKYFKSQKDTTNSYYKRGTQLLEKIKKNPGKLVSAGEDYQRRYDVDPKAYPQHIAFLIDKDCGSATEFFIYEGKQSKKVTLFGTNSHGVMDYGDDQNFDLCDGTFNLAVPWGRNGWVREFRIDNIGFAPDVRIPEGEKDWVGFVQRYYAKKDKAGK